MTMDRHICCYLYSSALAVGFGVVPAYPPVTSTSPSFRVVAVCENRCVVISAVGENTRLLGSNSSDDDRKFPLASCPPMTSTFPLLNSDAPKYSRGVPILPTGENIPVPESN